MSDIAMKKVEELCPLIERNIPRGHGFFVFVFPFNGSRREGEGRANYASNAKREDVLNCMKEFLIQAGHEEDWMKNI